MLNRFRLVPHFGHDEGQIVLTFYLVYFFLDVGYELVEVILQLPRKDSYLFNRYILLVEQLLDDPPHTVKHIQTQGCLINVNLILLVADVEVVIQTFFLSLHQIVEVIRLFWSLLFLLVDCLEELFLILGTLADKF